MFCATQAHTSARPAAPSRGTRRKQTANTHTTRRSLYSQIARASRARSCERPPSAGSEGAARRTVRRGAKDREHARTANRDKGKRTSRSTPARRVRHTARRVRRALARSDRSPPRAERESGARGATDGTNETMPNPQQRAARERGRGISESARRVDSPRVALGVRPRVRSWCPHPPPAPARGCAGGARERRARSDGRDERRSKEEEEKSTQRANAPARLRR